MILINSYIKKWMVKAALDAGALEGPGRDARRQSQLSTANSVVRGVEGDTDDAHWTVTWTLVVNVGRNFLGYPQCIHNGDLMVIKWDLMGFSYWKLKITMYPQCTLW